MEAVLLRFLGDVIPAWLAASVPIDVAAPGLFLGLALGVIVVLGVLVVAIVIAAILVIRGIKKRRAHRDHS
ncbi:MAG: hypothetical protein P4L50_18225 [Anaerolineaceae bacterium]|nr:hypothetical protein [Anaerolineaceae bacterium]